MSATDFWYEFTDLLKSGEAVFSIGSFGITGSMLLWVVGITFAILLVFGLRAGYKWITGADLKKGEQQVANTEIAPPVEQQASPLPLNNATTTAQTDASNETAKSPVASASPQELLTDTSGRKRSLHDFVTPDAIHTDVVKQTLNNDFPYETLKPNPVSIGVPEATTPATSPEPSTQPVSQTTEGNIAVSVQQPPVKPDTPATDIPSPEVKANESFKEPMTSSVTESGQSAATTPQVAVALSPQENTLTNPPKEAATPETSATSDTITPVVTTSPAASMIPNQHADVSPAAVQQEQPQQTAQVQAPSTLPTQEKASSPSPVVVAESSQSVPQTTSPQTQPTTTTAAAPQNAALPPLPKTEPRASMVVGVADAKGPDAITAKEYNPADPVIP